MDRNFNTMQVVVIVVKSLSARRAWIEIGIPANLDADHAVALRKESVDRNARKIRPVVPDICRSPQGERG